jgi:hypothetical protein
VIDENGKLGRQLGLENMQQLYAERALLRREKELLCSTNDGLLFRDVSSW